MPQVHLTLHCDYSLRVLLYLANVPERLATTGEISKAYGISKHHLVRVVQDLGRHGFVAIHPGRSGGLQLAQPAAEIRIGDVVRRIEPGFRVVECFDTEHNTCPIVPVCRLKGLLVAALNSFFEALDRHTLADLAGPEGRRRFEELLSIAPAPKTERKRYLMGEKSVGSRKTDSTF